MLVLLLHGRVEGARSDGDGSGVLFLTVGLWKLESW